MQKKAPVKEAHVHVENLVTRAGTLIGKLAIFLPSLGGGGAERVMVNLAHIFAERGFKVDIVLAEAEGPYLREVHPKVRVVNLRSTRVIFSLFGLMRYLRRERPQVLLSALEHTNVVALLAQRLSGVSVRTVVGVHNTLTRSTVNAQSLNVRSMPFWLWLSYPWAYAVTAVSEGVAKDLEHIVRLPREQVKVIYNPVVTPELLKKAHESLDTHPWFAANEPPVVLGVGRLTPQKDFPTLIKAFALVKHNLPARLMILGEGEDRPQLEVLVRDLGLEADVSLPGFVDNPFKYMRHAGVFVLSSLWEGLPTVLIEALASGATVVSTDCPSGPMEILEAGRWGRLTPVGDVAALAQAIQEALTDPNDSKEEAVQRARDRFGLNEVADRYLEVLFDAG